MPNWQDAPLADEAAGAAGARPAWMAAPVMDEALVPPEGGGLGRSFGLGLRNVVEGIGALPAMAYDAASIPQNALNAGVKGLTGYDLGLSARSGAENLSGALDAAGLAKPRTQGERLAGKLIEGVAGAIPTMGVGAGLQAAGMAPRAARMLLDKPVTQITSGAGAGLAAGGAEEGGAGTVGTLAAGLAGGVGAAAVPNALSLAGRLGQGLTMPFTQGGRERIVGDAMLRQSSDPATLAARLRAGLDDPGARLPDSPATTAQASRDAGLAAFEGGLRSNSTPPPDGGLTPQARFAGIDAERNAARSRELPAPMPDAAGGQGAEVRAVGGQAEGVRRGQVSAAYEAIDPEGASQFPADPVRGMVRAAQDKYFGPLSGGSRPLDAIERDLLDQGGDTLSFASMQNLRSRLSAVIADADAKGDARLAAAANQVKGGMDDLAERAAAAVRQAEHPVTAADLERQAADEGAAQFPGLATTLRGADEAANPSGYRPAKSLAQFLKEQGGIRPDGDVRQTMDGARNYPGLMSNGGMALDRAAAKAREAGYFPEHPNLPDRPDTLDSNALLGALDDHFRGTPRYPDFGGRAGRSGVLDGIQDDFDRQGINASVNDPEGALRAMREVDPAPAPAGPRPDGDVSPVEQPFTPGQAAAWRDAQRKRVDLGRDFERDETGTNAVANALRTSTPDAKRAAYLLGTPAAVRQAVRALGDEGLPVLRQAFRDKAFTASIGKSPVQAADGSPMLTAPGFLGFWQKNRDVARELFPPGHYERLELLAADFGETATAERIGKSRGSDTARNLSVGNVISMASQGVIPTGNIAMNALLSPTGWLFRKLGAEDGVRQLLVEAAADPVLAQRLTAAASAQNVEQAVAYLKTTMRQRAGQAAGDAAGRSVLRAGMVAGGAPRDPEQERRDALARRLSN